MYFFIILGNTEHTNEKILENYRQLTKDIQANFRNIELWIRTPVIPGTTDGKENISGIGAFISSHCPELVKRWELCAFNNLCRDKYKRLGLNWEYMESDLLTQAFMENMATIARSSGVDPKIVHWSGSTKVEEKNKGDKGSVLDFKNGTGTQTCYKLPQKKDRAP